MAKKNFYTIRAIEQIGNKKSVQMDAEDKVPDAETGKLRSTGNILSLRYIVIICLIAVIAYPFLTPSYLSGILPLVCCLATLIYPFYPRGVQKDLYKRITTGFIFSISLLILFHLVSGKLTTRDSEDIFKIFISVLLALISIVIVVDIFITFKKINSKFWLRLIPALMYISVAALFITVSDGSLTGTYRTVAPYVTFSAVMVSGILLAIYAWIDIDRNRINWFYIFCSFVSVVALPVVMLVVTKIITQPVLVSSSCHATSVLKQRNGMLGKYLYKRRRIRYLQRLKENGDISADFYSGMSGLIIEKKRK